MGQYTYPKNRTLNQLDKYLEVKQNLEKQGFVCVFYLLLKSGCIQKMKYL